MKKFIEILKKQNRSFLECDVSAVSMEMEKKTNTDQQQ